MDTLVQLCPTRGSVVGFVRPRLDFRCKPSMSIAYCTCAYCTCHWPVTTCVYFDILKSDIFDAGGSQCHIIMSVLHAGRFPYVHWHLGVKLFTSFLNSTLVPLALNLPVKSHLRSGYRYQTVVTNAVRIRSLSVH